MTHSVKMKLLEHLDEMRDNLRLLCEIMNDIDRRAVVNVQQFNVRRANKADWYQGLKDYLLKQAKYLTETIELLECNEKYVNLQFKEDEQYAKLQELNKQLDGAKPEERQALFAKKGLIYRKLNRIGGKMRWLESPLRESLIINWRHLDHRAYDLELKFRKIEETIRSTPSPIVSSDDDEAEPPQADIES